MKKIIAISLLTLIGFNASANDNSKRLIELLIKDDISVFKKGGSAILSEYIPSVNASQLISEYSNNQYKYEKAYDKQLVNIKTVASGVKTDLSGDPYIVANGKNQFEYVSLELKNKDDAMNINKGNKIDMICVGTKNNVMFPTLKNCVTTDSYFQKFLETTMKSINKLEKDDKPDSGFEAFYLGLWEFDINNPGTLDKYKTASELSKSKSDFDKVLALAESKATDEVKNFTMPKP
ncbi:hypothetical protein GQ597_10660 [Gilliamella sp. Pra-s65]|uniref:OB-fold protein n=1 Tax=unclassified Gilliamella TaxID=2685620 RepID=UPI001365FB9B|nr:MULTISPECIES: hypothetical protein [unclassified Gilliamella]MWN91163.1 hypothetical protein [Gilliamella sp. Pra-s65]MWP74011.1 hypothetical protein [Gilliamella sp. Pra-s52]